MAFFYKYEYTNKSENIHPCCDFDKKNSIIPNFAQPLKRITNHWSRTIDPSVRLSRNIQDIVFAPICRIPILLMGC